MFHLCEFVILPILVGFEFSFLYIQFLTIAVAVVSDISVTSVTLTIRLTTKEHIFLIDNAMLVLITRNHVNRRKCF
jgi:hypothetical protein